MFSVSNWFRHAIDRLLIMPPTLKKWGAYCFRFVRPFVIMPPTLKKWGAYCFRFVRPFVRSSVCPSVQKKFKARVLKFHIWFPPQKIAYRIFFLV